MVKKINEINAILLVILLVVLSTILGYKLNDLFQRNDIKLLLSTSENNNCSGLDLIETSICLKAQLKEFYKFNISNVGVELTLEELKQVGGVCSHYAQYYKNNLDTLGFNTELKDIYVNDTGHEFTIAWNNNLSTYCILDQLNIDCMELRR